MLEDTSAVGDSSAPQFLLLLLARSRGRRRGQRGAGKAADLVRFGGDDLSGGRELRGKVRLDGSMITAADDRLALPSAVWSLLLLLCTLKCCQVAAAAKIIYDQGSNLMRDVIKCESESEASHPPAKFNAHAHLLNPTQLTIIIIIIDWKRQLWLQLLLLLLHKRLTRVG